MPWVHPIRCLLWVSLLALFWPEAVFALDSVTIVVSEEGGTYTEFANELSTSLSQGNKKLAVKLLRVSGFTNEFVTRNLGSGSSQLLVGVGTTAMDAIAQKTPAVPMLNVLVPRVAFLKASKTNARTADARNFSAIFADQPWSRQLALIRTVLKGKPRIGILLGADPTESSPALFASAREAGLPLNIETIASDTDLLPALKRLLNNSEAILALPDPDIYNRNNIQTILLSSYRQKVPLFGFSASYVKAGALSAVYSTPAQISQQTSELILGLPANANLPAPQFPRYYSVGVNTQVARSLGIAIDEEPALLNKLRQTAERAP